MRLHPEETEAGPWRRVDDHELRALLTRLLPDGRGVLLVDGRSGGGKSTFAERAAALLVGRGRAQRRPRLAPRRRGLGRPRGGPRHRAVAPWGGRRLPPPGWVARGRDGSVTVPADVGVLVLEGVGAGRASLAAHADAVVWVQSDRDEARERGLRRDVELGRTREEAERFWDEWMSAEEPFLAHDRRGTGPTSSSTRGDRWAAGRTTLAAGPRSSDLPR